MTTSKQPVWVWFALSSAWLLLDQITKAIVMSSLRAVDSIPIIGDLVRFTYAENVGMAFSIRWFPPWVLLIIAVIASIALAFYMVKHPPTKLTGFSLALILAGAVGNAIDRARFGFVIDFIDCDFPDFIMQRWPIFNVADSGITIGAVLLGIVLIFEKTEPVTTSNDAVTLDFTRDSK